MRGTTYQTVATPNELSVKFTRRVVTKAFNFRAIRFLTIPGRQADETQRK